MLLTEFKRIQEIDTAISNLQTELAGLYEQRSKIVLSTDPETSLTQDSSPAHETSGNTTVKTSWEHEAYQVLSSTWSQYDVKIPAYEKLQKKLVKARQILDDLALTSPGSSFDITLVPPAEILQKVFNQNSVSEKLHFHSDISTKKLSKKSREWKLYIVALSPLPAVTNIEDAYTGKNVPDYNMPGLNTVEYAVFCLTHPSFIKENSWSVLAKDHDNKTSLVPCAVKLGGSFKFELDNGDVLIGENHFRPAMEINVKK